MKWRTRRLLQFYLSALTVVLPATASATLVAYDGFRLSLPVYGVSGTGFTGPWSASDRPFEVGDPSLCYPNLRTSGLSLTNGAANGTLSRQFAVPFGAPGTTMYVSFLLQPEAADGWFSGLYVAGNAGVLFVGKPGGGATTNYVVETSGGAGQVATDAAVVPSTPALLVLKIQFTAGADMVTLYANPTAGGTEPAAGVVKADLDLGTVQSVSFASFDVAYTFDELRVGTTYADVVPVGGAKRCR